MIKETQLKDYPEWFLYDLFENFIFERRCEAFKNSNLKSSLIRLDSYNEKTPAYVEKIISNGDIRLIFHCGEYVRDNIKRLKKESGWD